MGKTPTKSPQLLPISASDLRSLPNDKAQEILGQLSPKKLEELKHEWRFWARPEQLEPEGDWNVWFYVYHIKLPHHRLDEGYVGVSKRPKVRWSDHRSRKENPLLSNAIKKHGDDLRYTILGCFDKLEDALWQEFTLRPLDRMGWNLIKGGGYPPEMGAWNKGKHTPEHVRDKQSKTRKGRFGGVNHPRARLANIYCYKTNQLLYKGVAIREWAKLNGFQQGHLSATARGELKQHKGIYARYNDAEAE